jgi:hypothetical protein
VRKFSLDLLSQFLNLGWDIVARILGQKAKVRFFFLRGVMSSRIRMSFLDFGSEYRI